MPVPCDESVRMSVCGGMATAHDHGAILVSALCLTDPAEWIQQPFQPLPPHSAAPIVVIAGKGIRIPSDYNVAVGRHCIDSTGFILKTAKVDHAVVCVPAESVGLSRTNPGKSHDHGAVGR